MATRGGHKLLTQAIAASDASLFHFPRKWPARGVAHEAMMVQQVDELHQKNRQNLVSGSLQSKK